MEEMTEMEKKYMYIIVDKEDKETVELLKSKLDNYEVIEETSFSGVDIVELVIPIVAALSSSIVLRELVKGLMEKGRIKVRYGKFEYEGDYEKLEKVVDAVSNLKKS